MSAGGFSLFRFSAFPLFRFSAFPLFRFSAFPLFVGASLLANGVSRWPGCLGLTPLPLPNPLPEGRGGLSVPREGLVSTGNHSASRLTPEHQHLPNGPLSLQGEG
ncbi:hypothetical protein FCN13_29875 [Pseudomonas sp. UMC631]|nr:hypothetical protein [Pseudomonas sp. UMA643]NTY23031.1 hypothetical protein [Pseudomonas sp. UMA603]NTY29386.1 hypothetical protein [Pseudomonas sp. UMC3129]NTY57789.1 hypothetical protein [Pseudomonas sp. UMC631]NTY64505.1 hypothetical protein [Pseudomonas sp. UMC3106]NUA32623.1 hypothetical protein [Pseudomonas sp. UMA601]